MVSELHSLRTEASDASSGENIDNPRPSKRAKVSENPPASKRAKVPDSFSLGDTTVKTVWKKNFHMD